MSRNSSGTYSTPAGQPVVSGTTISSTAHNTLVSDLAAEVTDSLSRSGKGGMTAPLRTPDGTVNAPAHAFTSETGTGLYRIGAADLGVAVNEVKRLEISATGVTVPDNLTVQGAVGITLTQGDVSLSEAASQYIYKANGGLGIRTTGAHDVTLGTNGAAKFTVRNSDGALVSAGGTLTGLPTPSAASDAATKGYVDSGQTNTAFSGKPTATATVSGDGATTLATKGYVEGLVAGITEDVWASGGSWGTGWGNNSYTRCYKAVNGVVTLNLSATISSGTGATVCTLPTGFHPEENIYVAGFDNQATRVFYPFTISELGTVSISGASAPAAGRSYQFSVSFKAA